MTPISPGPIRSRIEQLHGILDRIADLRKSLEGLPDYFRDDVSKELRSLAEEFSDKAHSAKPPPKAESSASFEKLALDMDALEKRRASDSNVRSRMHQYFLQRGNRPSSVMELAKATMSTRGGIQTILYKRPEGEFERGGTRSSQRAPITLWKMTDSAFEKATNEHEQEMEQVARDKELLLN